MKDATTAWIYLWSGGDWRNWRAAGCESGVFVGVCGWSGRQRWQQAGEDYEVFRITGAALGVTTVPKVRKTAAEWKAQLSALQFDVTRRAATEYAYSGPLENERIALGCIAVNHPIAITRCLIRTKFESEQAGRVFTSRLRRRM